MSTVRAAQLLISPLQGGLPADAPEFAFKERIIDKERGRAHFVHDGSPATSRFWLEMMSLTLFKGSVSIIIAVKSKKVNLIRCVRKLLVTRRA